MINKICKTCGKHFKTHECWERKGEVKYCSKKCFYQTLKGKKIEWIKDFHKKSGKDHYLWKGNNATYQGIHIWLSRWYKKEKCDFCGSKKNLEWSNKDGRYIRKRKEFLVLCRKCHRKIDHLIPKSKMKNSRLTIDKIVPYQKYPKQRLIALT